MKKYIIFFVIAIAIVSCQWPMTPSISRAQLQMILLQQGERSESIILDDEEDSHLTFGSNAGVISVDFITSEAWTVRVVPEAGGKTPKWVNVSPNAGTAGESRIEIIVGENSEYSPRNATVVITTANSVLYIKLTQKQKDALLLSPNKIELGEEGGKFDVEVRSNVDVQHKINVDWIKLISTKAMTTSKLTFTVEANERKEPREGTIIFFSGDLKEEVTVYQAEEGDIFVVSQKEYKLTKDAQEIKIELRSNIGFSTIEIPKDVDWITEVETKAASTYTKYLLISENNTTDNREAKVDIFSADKSKKESITIWQSQTDSLGVVKSEYEVAPEGRIIEVDVRHNVDIAVEIPEEYQEWIRRVETKGMQSTKIKFEVTQNDSGIDREGTIFIKGDNIEKAVNIKQKSEHTKIYYTSTDGRIVEPTRLRAWSENNTELMFTNTYGDDIGVIEFNGIVSSIDLSYEGSFNNPNKRLLSFDGISNMVYLMDANSMFFYCSSLETLDLNSINTENVTDMWAMFGECSLLHSLDLSNFNTENVTIMSCMFYGCKSLQTLDVSNFSTDNVTTMSQMFTDCSSIKTLDLSNFNTENVMSMFMMFDGCSSLQTLDVSNFNTEKVTGMIDMFSNCSSLQTLDVSNFNTENVTNMRFMFSNCSSLQTLDVSNFNTEKVTDMSYMFYYCRYLQTLDVSNFNTENVTDMWSMFGGCSSLQTLDVSNFNTEHVTNMSHMFGCSSLQSLDVRNFNTKNVTNMSGMFSGCSSLQSIDVRNFNTKNVTNMSGMFGCSSLQSIDVSNFNTEKVTDMSYMFSGCSSLQSLDVRNFNTKNVTNMSWMFSGCSSLQSIDVRNFSTENVTNMSGMFSGCSSLQSIDVRNFSTENVTNMSWMFNNLSLQTLDVSNFNTEKVTDMSYMFYYCRYLQTLDVSNFNTENVTDMSYMFNGCPSLQILKVGENTNKGKISEDTFRWIKSNGILYYPQGCDYSEWLSDKYLGAYGWTGQEY